jgi:hypothetical protein
MTGTVGAIRPPVRAVLSVSGLSKIADPVVRSNAVFVVNLMLWPFVEHIGPSETMSRELFPIDFDAEISIDIESADRLSDADPHPLVNQPFEFASQRVVFEDFAQPLYRDKAI